MKWLQTLGEHARAIAALIALASLTFSGVAWAAKSYIDSRVDSVVTQAVGEFRTEWRCSEWSEELEARLLELADEQLGTAQRIAIQRRIEKLRALIADNRCSQFDQ